MDESDVRQLVNHLRGISKSRRMEALSGFFNNYTYNAQ